jgi:4a-hydroxytetrahydrobiopterin dehydratase
MSELAGRQCVPCKGGVPPLAGEALVRLMRMLAGDWRLIGEHHIEIDRLQIPSPAGTARKGI